MKKSCLALILLLFVGSAFAQKRATRLIFNGGVQKAGMYEDGGFQAFQCFEGCFYVSQIPALSFDFNVLYQVPSKKTNLSFIYGLGINQKSWNEEGLSSNGAGPIDNPHLIGKFSQFRNQLGSITSTLIPFSQSLNGIIHIHQVLLVLHQAKLPIPSNFFRYPVPLV